jgi:hypothetical protein
MKSIAQSVMEEITSPDFREKSKNIVRGWAIENKFKERHALILRNKIREMTSPEFLAFVSKICEREYKIGNSTEPSPLFMALYHAVCEPSNERPVKEFLLTRLHIYKGISFRVYVDNGQKFKVSMRKRVLFKSK